MTEHVDHSARIAHGALTGVLNDPAFDLARYLSDELADAPEEARGALLAHTLAAAVTQHAGTLLGLEARGFNVQALLTRYPELRHEGTSTDD